MSFSTERLIVEIKSRPIIWNYRVKGYRNVAVRRRVWEEICAAFEANFDEKSDEEKMKSVSAMQKKWRNIRNTFSKDIRKIAKRKPKAKTTKPYLYFNNLLFLKPFLRTQRRKANSKRKTGNNEIVIIDDDDGDESNPSRNVVNKKKTDNTQDDADRQFLASLLPDLQNMEESVKLEVKYEIMGVMKRFKDRASDYQTGSSSSRVSQYTTSPSMTSPPLAPLQAVNLARATSPSSDSNMYLLPTVFASPLSPTSSEPQEIFDELFSS